VQKKTRTAFLLLVVGVVLGFAVWASLHRFRIEKNNLVMTDARMRFDPAQRLDVLQSLVFIDANNDLIEAAVGKVLMAAGIEAVVESSMGTTISVRLRDYATAKDELKKSGLLAHSGIRLSTDS
jgi:hypothetical protein